MELSVNQKSLLIDTILGWAIYELDLEDFVDGLLYRVENELEEGSGELERFARNHWSSIQQVIENLHKMVEQQLKDLEIL